ncbi:hypothetical protein Tco_0180229 [Tanacetum coccineum]
MEAERKEEMELGVGRKGRLLEDGGAETVGGGGGSEKGEEMEAGRLGGGGREGEKGMVWSRRLEGAEGDETERRSGKEERGDLEEEEGDRQWREGVRDVMCRSSWIRGGGGWRMVGRGRMEETEWVGGRVFETLSSSERERGRGKCVGKMKSSGMVGSNWGRDRGVVVERRERGRETGGEIWRATEEALWIEKEIDPRERSWRLEIGKRGVEEGETKFGGGRGEGEGGVEARLDRAGGRGSEERRGRGRGVGSARDVRSESRGEDDWRWSEKEDEGTENERIESGEFGGPGKMSEEEMSRKDEIGDRETERKLRAKCEERRRGVAGGERRVRMGGRAWRWGRVRRRLEILREVWRDEERELMEGGWRIGECSEDETELSPGELREDAVLGIEGNGGRASRETGEESDLRQRRLEVTRWRREIGMRKGRGVLEEMTWMQRAGEKSGTGGSEGEGEEEIVVDEGQRRLGGMASG